MPSVPGIVFSSISRVSGGIFQTIQWSNVPMGASGSSTIRAKPFVSSGMPSMVKWGFTSAPSQVYFAGISLLFSNAGLLTNIFFTSYAFLK
jgi:hypothetical protein